MKIYIPTMKRTKEQITFSCLPEQWKAETVFICPKDEVGEILDRWCKGTGAQVIAQPKDVKGISQVRQMIIENAEKKLIMLDDDLIFAKRKEGNGVKLFKADPSEVGLAINCVASLLGRFAHVSISTRQGNNTNEGSTQFVGRGLRALAYRADILRRHNVRFDRVKLMEDFDVTLQLLRLGFGNMILFSYCQDQRKTQAAGGCSVYRDEALQKASAERLAELHPGFVKVVQKETKNGWDGMKTRTDVRISWVKAYRSAGRVMLCC